MKAAMLLGLSLSLGCLAGCDTSPPSEVWIGLNTELSGPFSQVGKSSENAARLFVEELNKNGGLRIGSRYYPIHLEVEDNRSRPEHSAAVSQKMMDTQSVVAVVGPNISACAMAASGVAQAQRCPMLTPCSTAPQVTWNDSDGSPKEWVFRTCFTDTFLAKTLAGFAVDTLRARRAAILYDTASESPASQANLFLQHFENRGGQVLAMEVYQSGEKELSKQLEKIRATRPDIIFLPAYYTDVPNISRQIRQAGITAPVLGTDNWAIPGALNDTYKDLKNSYFSSHHFMKDPSPGLQRFLGAYKARYGAPADDNAALTYDSLGVLCQAITNAGAFDRATIRKALSQLTGYEGVTGRISYGEGSGDPLKNVVILKVEEEGVQKAADVSP